MRKLELIVKQFLPLTSSVIVIIVVAFFPGQLTQNVQTCKLHLFTALLLFPGIAHPLSKAYSIITLSTFIAKNGKVSFLNNADAWTLTHCDLS